jgi:hypothetical protein
VGATVVVSTEGDGKQWNLYSPAVGYASTSDVPVHFGLGGFKGEVRVEIVPVRGGGEKRVLEGVKPNQVLNVLGGR